MLRAETILQSVDRRPEEAFQTKTRQKLNRFKLKHRDAADGVVNNLVYGLRRF